MAQPILHLGHKLWLTLSLLAAGCTNNSTSDPLPRIQPSPRINDIYQNRSPEVMRYDRYTLVSTRPDDAQRDPLNQMVEITMPAQLVRTVGDGFRYVLLESGYSLCPVSSSVFAELLNQPLPAVQRTIGPVRLSEALQILAGPAWRLRVDDVNREVCFTLRDAYRDFTPQQPAGYPATAMAGSTSRVPVRQSGNPFSGTSNQSSFVSPAYASGPFASNTTTKAPLKPENISVPSPVLMPVTPVKSVASQPQSLKSAVPVLTKPLIARPATTSQAKAAVLPVTKPPVNIAAPLKPTTALPPSPPAMPAHPVPVIKPLFAPGAPVSVTPSGPLWRAEVGSTLKETLNRWAAQAPCDNGGNWVVIWPVGLDYRIDAPLEFHGNFESVLVQVFNLYRQAEKPLFAQASRLQCLVSVSDRPGGN
jgi:type IV pili sensor histidine kinase/response regulator